MHPRRVAWIGVDHLAFGQRLFERMREAFTMPLPNLRCGTKNRAMHYAVKRKW